MNGGPESRADASAETKTHFPGKTSPDGRGVRYPHVSTWTKPMLDGWNIARTTDIVAVNGVFHFKVEGGKDKDKGVVVTWTATKKTSSSDQFRLSKPRIWDRYLWAAQFTIEPPSEDVFAPLPDASAMASTQQEAGFPAEAGLPVDSAPEHVAIATKFFTETGILNPGASVGVNAKNYHHAKITAARGMRMLLHHICARLEPLPRKALGDDPFPTNWLVYAIVWSVMNGHPSLRVSASMLDDERHKGAIEWAPSHPTLRRFLISPFTTPYLNEILYALGSPFMRAYPTQLLEVDGFGLGNTWNADYRLGLVCNKNSDRDVRWYHPVIMADPRNHYIAAGVLTDSKTGEPTKAREMLEGLKQYGDRSYILGGDGVYSSAEVMAAVVNSGGIPIIPWDTNSVHAIVPAKRNLFVRDPGIVDTLYRMFMHDRLLYKRMSNWRSQVEGVISAMRRNANGMHIRCATGPAPNNEFLAYCIAHQIWVLYRASIVSNLDINLFGGRFEDDVDPDEFAA